MLNADDISKIRKILLELIPEDGSTIGNITLLQKLKSEVKKKHSIDISDTDYWEIRTGLIDEGIISRARGQGGSVYKVQPTQVSLVVTKAKKLKESDLYQSFQKYIHGSWVKDNNIKDNYVVENTSAQGKRRTGGRWTRPDLALIAVRTYEYIPGKYLEVVTFEVKPQNYFEIEAVFETAAHSKFANKSYLAIFTPGPKTNTVEFERVREECERFGVGLIVFSEPENLESYFIELEAERRTPDPDDVNTFIKTQIQRDNQSKILQWVK